MRGRINSKSALAVVLSRLDVFLLPKVSIEQYPTDPEIAAEVIWSAFMKGDIENKVIADLGCGTGILGLGALLLGANKVYFIDIDKDALNTAKNNLLFLKSEGLIEENIDKNQDSVFRCMDIDGIDDFINEEKRENESLAIHTTLQNPPFGTRKVHIDRFFLGKALMIAPVVYSFHKTSTEKFIKAYCRDEKVSITDTMRFQFPLKKTLGHHKKRIQRIEVSCYRLEKKRK